MTSSTRTVTEPTVVAGAAIEPGDRVGAGNGYASMTAEFSLTTSA